VPARGADETGVRRQDEVDGHDNSPAEKVRSLSRGQAPADSALRGKFWLQAMIFMPKSTAFCAVCVRKHTTIAEIIRQLIKGPD